MMFQVVWIVLCTASLVPIGIASLRGWTPRWVRGCSARVTRARGIAAFTLYAGSLTPAVLSLAGVPGDELVPLRITAGPLLILAATILVLWASVTERRDTSR
ncbi:hypothetical protein ACGFMM_32570 [Streptomyces sp. NPDC048604]|uniref:hypothetical protein n=1 Tax=Streptomyces sp. NPDC048604 TaxID=3365578 RepID=UPI00371E9ED8